MCRVRLVLLQTDFVGSSHLLMIVPDSLGVFLLKNKHDVASILPEFYTMVSTKFHARVKVFRTDNGGEYVNNTLASFFLAQGIIHQMTTPFTPLQNGVSERKNRQLLEVARSFMLDMSVSHHLWGHAVLSATYLINRTPSRVLDFKTPHDVFGDHVFPVSISKLPPKVFRCVVYVHVYSHQRSKLDHCALRCVFIGYSSTQKGYKCYHPPTQKVHVTLDVTFHEEVPYYVSHSSLTHGERGSKLEFLGIEIARSKRGIFLSQIKDILDLLAETGMLDCKPIDTPSEQNHKLGLYPDQVPTDKERYQRLGEKLIYLSHTRPDIAYAVSVVSQFMHSPSEDRMGVVMRILRYLKVTSGKGLMFCKYGHTDVEGYTDVDWASSITDRHSTSGYFTFVGNNLVTWRSKKQKVVSRSSAEAEYRGMAQDVCELLWLRRLLRDLGFEPQKPMNLYCDNKAAIAIAHNPVQHDRTNHVEVDRHFVKEKLDAEIISFPFISSEYQLADVLTKAVSTTVFLNSLDKLGMRDIFAPT
ncbi:hypothetical protein L3X38_033625 [Prunus dulcis]|uniref:Integrase catalytic domain-containing protein n=1 Tax=Prunus dulcis TaxID=3755 RepID=A0AAD4VHZ2_PRUDU|nr:hypothetical protein L3X38_033625 [Prunus dulcis]